MKDTNKQIVHILRQLNTESIKYIIDDLKYKNSIGQFEEEKNIFISFKGVAHTKENTPFFKTLINTLKRIIESLKINISFIDYSAELYGFLKSILTDTNIQLFKNSEVASIFLYPDEFSKDIQLLVYDEDIKNIQSLSSALIANKFKVVVVNNMHEFLLEMKRSIYKITITRTTLNKSMPDKKSTNTFKLSKKVISNLPIFMNKAVETLVSFTGLKAQKISHCIQEFDMEIAHENISAVMTFYGDLEGYFTLVFPKNIAVIALESLLKEKIHSNDTATLEDGVGEFCNIITGSTKTAFDEQGIKILFELPKTFHSLKETVDCIGNNKGVWMDMELSGKPFYMFITK